MIEENADKFRLQAHLKALTEFMAGPVYAGYISSVTTEIEVMKMNIIATEPVDRASEIEGFKLRGELRCLEQFLTRFEDGRANLEDRIEEEIERENEARENQQ